MNDINKLIERGAELARKHEEIRNEIINNPDVSQELKDKFIQLEEEFKKNQLNLKQHPPYVSDDFQIGPDGAYEHTED